MFPLCFRLAHDLRRYRLTPRHPPLFHFPSHPPLLAFVLPRLPARLCPLQNPQFLYAPHGPLRPAGPRVRPAERKTRRQKHRHHQQRNRHQVRAPHIESATATRATPAFPPTLPRATHLAQKGSATTTAARAATSAAAHSPRSSPPANRSPGSAPSVSQHPNRHRQQKRRKSKYLEQQIRRIRSRRPDPIPRRILLARRRAHIERHIPRVIRQQRQPYQDRHCDTQKPNQLVDPFIFCRCKEAHLILLSFLGKAECRMGRGAGAPRIGGTPKSYQTRFRRTSSSYAVFPYLWSAAARRRFYGCSTCHQATNGPPASKTCHPDRRPAFLAGRSGGIAAQFHCGTVTPDCALGSVFQRVPHIPLFHLVSWVVFSALDG